MTLSYSLHKKNVTYAVTEALLLFPALLIAGCGSEDGDACLPA